MGFLVILLTFSASILLENITDKSLSRYSVIQGNNRNPDKQRYGGKKGTKLGILELREKKKKLRKVLASSTYIKVFLFFQSYNFFLSTNSSRYGIIKSRYR